MHLAKIDEKMTKITPKDVLYVLFRHKRKSIPFFLAVVITVTLGTLITPRIYQSEAKIMLRLGRENVTLDPTVPAGPILSVGQSREYELKSEIEILKSRTQTMSGTLDWPVTFLTGLVKRRHIQIREGS
jgi:uncharacterized protein involved in exopolysaccharide biosynthesis